MVKLELASENNNQEKKNKEDAVQVIAI